MEREREKIIPDNMEKERTKLADVPTTTEQKRSDTKERDNDKGYEASSRNNSSLDRGDRDTENVQDVITNRKTEKTENFEGKFKYRSKRLQGHI